MRRLVIIVVAFILLAGVVTSYMLIKAAKRQNVGAREQSASTGEENPTMVRIENQFVSISFSKSNGSIVSLYDKSKQIEFIQNAKSCDPFRLDWHSGMDGKFTGFTYEKDNQFKDGTGYILKWNVNPKVQVVGKIQLSTDSNEIRFYSGLVNDSDESIMALEYPVIGNITNITQDGENDYLAHSFATGFLIHNPMKNFNFNGDGLRFMPYPEGFSGATMQFFTYYGQGKGGLYFAAYDGDFYPKWLNFYKGKNNLLEASFMSGYEDIGPKKGLKVNYPVVIKTMKEGTWYEAADIYKKWAIGQKWCQKGELTKREDAGKAKWLLEDMGLSTFGIDASYDRTQWIKEYHELANTNVFHVLGPDWPKKDQTYYKGIPGGFDDWFPARFNKDNIDTIEKQGDKYAPFEFDYLIDPNSADSSVITKSLQVMPVDIRSIDKYNFTFLCPLTDYAKKLHVLRDETLEKDYKVDSIYYDISANNILKTCMDPSHGHNVGAGREMTEAYKAIYTATKQAMNTAAGKYIPMGTEMINEVFLDDLDYYQTRAGAQPATGFEGYNIQSLIKSGEAELIPMFTYVYHEYGPVRLDGWGNLTEEIGDLFYFTVARTYLWGGLYELNYEYGPMEVLNGKENPPDEHYYLFDPAGYKLSPDRGRYISQFAGLRTGKGNKYLAYGKMLEPPAINPDKTELGYYNYTVPKNDSGYNSTGSIKHDSIIGSAWKYQDKSVGIFFANVKAAEQKLSFRIDMSKYALQGKQFTVKEIAGSSEADLAQIGNSETKDFEIKIPARAVVMIEIS